MRAVYVDESARDTRYYFIGGLIVDDRAARMIEAGLDGIGKLIEANVPGFDRRTEFHAHEMFHGTNQWDGVPVAWRVKASELIAKTIERSRAEYVFRGIDLVRLRTRYQNPYPAHLLTLAHLLDEIDSRMERVHDEMAIVLADDHHSATNSRRNLVDFKIRRVPGYTQRKLGNLVDTIYFGPSHASRLLQAADLATYFLNRDRTIVEEDPRSRAAVGRITARIRSVTVSEYVWQP
ncbi:DUF3800 domain-containing protein [Agromyces larvae]|uniref:DUF3800 domain-containing protein n=1 Tax=Agromyces larvae TaxID=2929802 RepID=A0ABY4C418_9MICO|nr:DUF3800 domain-containing protein [Agromyces larvae]UOE43510.1 DUF3800 domain-containing protein [Agromyces larvae]